MVPLKNSTLDILYISTIQRSIVDVEGLLRTVVVYRKNVHRFASKHSHGTI